MAVNSSIETTPVATDYYASNPTQNIVYNSFKAPIQIEVAGQDKISFGYNAMQQRSTMYYGSENKDKFLRPYRKYYSADGSMEIKATFDPSDSNKLMAIEFVTYIGGDAYSAPMIVKSDGNIQNYFYLHRDYQGCILAISDNVGAIVEKRIFDPWGSIVQVQDGAGNILDKLTFFERGYTGHQHLESVGLIHMNGRIYDPKLHRFLQPDNFVQDPYNTQSFSRYGYCWNNPLKYTDRNGEELVSAILIGAGVALAAYLTTSIISGTPITLRGAIIATFIGAISGAVTCGIGVWTQGIKTFVTKAATQALAHGIFQGLVSGVQGGGFWAGAAAGAISSVASSLYTGGGNWKGIAGKSGATTAGILAFGTIGGGTAAALAGGNFWQGAVTGLIVSGLNHALHRAVSLSTIIERLKNAGYDDPYAAASYENLNLQEFAQKVFPDMYIEGNRPRVTKVESLANDAEGLTPIEQRTNRTTGKTTFKIAGAVQISKTAYTSFLKLASTIGHEFRHVINVVNRNMDKWYAQGGEAYRKANSEYDSYNWEDNNGGDSNCRAIDKYRTQLSTFKF